MNRNLVGTFQGRTKGMGRRLVGLLLVLLMGGAWTSSAHAATFAVTYSDGASEGFNDPTLGPARRAAFEASLSYWASHLGASPVPITVSAAFDPLGGSATSAILGQASPVSGFRDFTSSNPRFKAGTFYGSALANHLAGRDLDTTRPEIAATFNSDVDNSTVLGNKNFYYGTDAKPGSDADFYSVALHEVGHGLNFTSQLKQDGNYLNAYPGIYDTFLTQGNTASRVRLTSLDAMGRMTAEVSDALYFDGARTQIANGGSPAKLFAPTGYQGGSSVSHLDENTFSLPNINELMTPVSSGPIHDAGPVGLGVFYDMGWAIPPVVTSITRADVSPTSARSVRFMVVFSTNVVGVDLNDFVVTTTGGITGASVATVTGNGNTYTVTVTTTGGSGTVRLDLVDNDTISDNDSYGVKLGGVPDAASNVSGDGSFSAGQVYTIGPSGSLQSLVAVSSGNSSVVGIDPSNGTQTVIASANPPLINSYGVTRAGDGTIYVANFSGPSIVKVSPSGTPTTLTSGNLLSGPIDIVLGPDGFLYVANNNNSTIVKVDVSTGAQTLLATGGSLFNPRGLAFDSAGKLYAANIGTGQVVLVDTVSGVQKVYAITGVRVWGIAFGPDGTLYACDNGNSSLVKVAPTTLAISRVATGGSISSPAGLALDKDGNLYVASEANNSIVRVTTAGVQTVVSGNLSGASDVALAEVAPPTVSILGAPRITEGNSSTVNATFTLALSGPSTSSVTVTVATADGTATAGSDYVALAPATFTFAAGATSQTVTVQIKGDTVVEPDETFSVNLSNVSGATLGLASALGTILNDDVSASPSSVRISEFRFGGPGGPTDEFIELANTSAAPITLTGWTLSAGTVTTALSPISFAGKTIPAGGHLLVTNSGGYSLGSTYPAGGSTFATGDVSYTGNIALGSTLTLTNSGGTTVDTVGSFAVQASSATNQYSFVRRMESGLPADSDSETSDFNLVDISSTDSTSGATGVGPLTAPRLGAPGPQNTSSPIQRNGQVTLLPINAATVGTPVEGRYASKGSPLDPNGRLTLRRTLTNKTSGPVTQIRFRIVAITGGASTTTSGVADLRALTSAGVTMSGTKVVQGIALDSPSTPTTLPTGFGPAITGNGGGLNSSWSLVTIPGGALAKDASVNVEFLFGIVQNGSYRVVVDTELLP